MSLGEAQQMYELLVKIDELLSGMTDETDTAIDKLPEIQDSAISLRQVERLALRWLILARRMGLPEEFGRAADFLSRVVVMIRMATMSINMMLSTNPVTAAIGIAGLAGAVVSVFSSGGSALEGY